ncbi:MAG TPA: carboxymuconolactone decarboxylase family protein [Xanthobacteraceae bacterium]|nr:carboxymuconolactone decarboxylase family protein [Xanthobacteraceae bacterium]
MPKAQSSRSRSSRTPRSPSPRLPALATESLTGEQQALVAAIKSGPRGRFSNEGPFAVYLHAPGYGMLAQELGAHLRFGTSVPPRLAEVAILCTARHWQAQYEWAAHARFAERHGVAPATIRDLQAGRAPKSAPPDEIAIYGFVKELYATRRVSNATYARVHKLLGDKGMVELVGTLGYYAMVSMTLNVFRMPVPPGKPTPFREPKS